MSEYAHHVALVQWCETYATRFPELAYIHHSPNEGKHHVSYRVKMKKMGVRAGFPDLFLPVPRGDYNGLFVELKFSKNKLTKDQKAYGAFLASQGYYVIVSYDWQEAAKAISQYLEGEVA